MDPQGAVQEEWRDIPGYEKSYQVSDRGRVRSLDRHVECCDGKTRFVPGAMIKACLSTSSSLHLDLCLSGESFTHSPGYLVLLAFGGPPPDAAHSKAVHWDGNPCHNWLGNLFWGSLSDAMLLAREHAADRQREAEAKAAGFADGELLVGAEL